MAATLTLLSASPEMLKYLWTYDGTGGAGSALAFRTLAEMLADLTGQQGPSPLKDILENTTDNAAFGQLQNSARLSTYANLIAMAGFTAITVALQNFVPDGHGLQVNGLDGSAGSAIVEVRYIHSIIR